MRPSVLRAGASREPPPSRRRRPIRRVGDTPGGRKGSSWINGDMLREGVFATSERAATFPHGVIISQGGGRYAGSRPRQEMDVESS